MAKKKLVDFLADIGDVDASSISDNYVLAYDQSTGRWVARPILTQVEETTLIEGGITKLSELEIDIAKDWLCFDITNLGSLTLCAGESITVKSPDGTILGVIRVGDSNELTLESPTKVTIDSGKLLGADPNTLEVGDQVAPLKRVIIGDTSSCRLKIPVGTDLYD